MNHTPGPWIIKWGTNVLGHRTDLDGLATVAVCSSASSNRVDCTPENEANARLVAAAPKLLAALENIIGAGGYGDEGNYVIEEARELIRDARNAIREAKGTT